MQTEIKRHVTNARMSRAVQFGDLVFVGGQTSDNDDADIRTQTRDVLAKIDKYLEMVGTDRSRILSAQIWLSDIDADFDAMNEVWDAWVEKDCGPARATVEAKLAAPTLRVEIAIVAAK
ncbi:RidA family protein [Burkholderia gladioli]|uniref:RidA family protein n=1 Tax=Burkholderia gladioli TaxID=28095 RepID=UPI001641A9B4|nr:RidA family protein [Burkholderia gladioli]